jgi:hypothetical protein
VPPGCFLLPCRCLVLRQGCQILAGCWPACSVLHAEVTKCLQVTLHIIALYAVTLAARPNTLQPLAFSAYCSVMGLSDETTHCNEYRCCSNMLSDSVPACIGMDAGMYRLAGLICLLRLASSVDDDRYD